MSNVIIAINGIANQAPILPTNSKNFSSLVLIFIRIFAGLLLILSYDVFILFPKSKFYFKLKKIFKLLDSSIEDIKSLKVFSQNLF